MQETTIDGPRLIFLAYCLAILVAGYVLNSNSDSGSNNPFGLMDGLRFLLVVSFLPALVGMAASAVQSKKRASALFMATAVLGGLAEAAATAAPQRRLTHCSWRE